ncbi:hypothetical protein [Streptomyces sp. Amel2xC10]|uniref:hypothetical protein n=1 Tax=Streptomyces sp. Amel2xC10 TaxID=1305826 RepID=UPI0035633F8A
MGPGVGDENVFEAEHADEPGVKTVLGFRPTHAVNVSVDDDWMALGTAFLAGVGRAARLLAAQVAQTSAPFRRTRPWPVVDIGAFVAFVRLRKRTKCSESCTAQRSPGHGRDLRLRQLLCLVLRQRQDGDVHRHRHHARLLGHLAAVFTLVEQWLARRRWHTPIPSMHSRTGTVSGGPTGELGALHTAGRDARRKRRRKK